ncbi:uncharacterized protein BDZ99DRAFT_571166 [Mytilinidion resinicola]|uniref:AAA+ ATPase domain-containing protein n=1 Tax=Mytilinidion resinicola TaxID=574789 RepID=A0A6A6YKC7_9PEZI|nr:uncharacterized protein BDZ99DRAFT_571166 [Mytilinidion resinicola]KAF2809322.1 hypothetical protein BDZ99DRAFT_571166 [Mytilinidion resinicola]
MPRNVSSTGVTITNPLVLYRALLATNRIKPDHAQYRLAIHLQKLYQRLIDYEPTIEYNQRLNQLNRTFGGTDGSTISSGTAKTERQGLWTSFLREKDKRDSLALTRILTSHDAALQLDSPQGLMLHGEVGTGKSMLIDLFADCLPNQKKKRWHFNTFMLETFARLEKLRRERSTHSLRNPSTTQQDDHSLLWLARDMVQTSPILFLDEFQLPDRASSKIMSNLMTGFFQLGGVLVATSNRMPEELAKAAGIEFSRPPSRLESLGWKFGLRGASNPNAQHGEFTAFLDVLKARCEIWEMNSGKDYRRLDAEQAQESTDGITVPISGPTPAAAARDTSIGFPDSSSIPSQPGADSSPASPPPQKPPKFFLVQPPLSAESHIAPTWTQHLPPSLNLPHPIPWTPTTLRIYARPLPIPRAFASLTHFTFAELCATPLGPADYISLASHYPHLILTAVPILTAAHHKNDARRFITLLDALYEARCKLLLVAAAGPDDLIFPDPVAAAPDLAYGDGNQEGVANADPETFSQAYQDATAPFRPNTSLYSSHTPGLAPDAMEDDPPNRARRRAGSAFADERAPGPDFGRTAAFTGEDERFAVKRARSRLWEMCSARWWARGGPDWHRPVPRAIRKWEAGGEKTESMERGGEGSICKSRRRERGG